MRMPRGLVKGLTALGLAGLLLHGPWAFSGAIDEGVAAYVAKDYERALALLQPEADQGSATALLFVGMMYEYGQGVPKDLPKATRLYREAAAGGDPDAMRILAMLDEGGPPSDAQDSTQGDVSQAGPDQPESAPMAEAAASEAGQARPAPAAATGGIEGAAWLRAQPPEYFTIQLIGSPRRDEVLDFAGRGGFTGEAALYETVHQGHPWYALVVGVFPDAKKAAVSAAALPAELRSYSPWIRQFRDIQRQMSSP